MSEPKGGEVVCVRCGAASMDHWIVNFSDGPMVGRAALVCPTSLFSAVGYGPDGTKTKHAKKD